MKKNKKKRNLTTVEKIAEKFNVKPHYVRSVLKVGRVKPINFGRIKRGRMALFVAYSDAIAEERGDIPDVPEVKPVMYYHTATNTVSESMYLEVLEAENSATVSTTFEPSGEPVMDSTHGEVSLTVDSEQVEQEHLLERVDDDHIRFICPCGCNNQFIINHKTLSYE